jgi:hypothetical protein
MGDVNAGHLAKVTVKTDELPESYRAREMVTLPPGTDFTLPQGRCQGKANRYPKG